MAAYAYKLPNLYKVPAQSVGELCERLKDSDTGLTPAAFVDASRDPASPTHNLLEWRDSIAAEKYREEQARQIIKSIVLVHATEDEVEKDRAFVGTPGHQHRYVELKSAIENDTWREHLLKEAKEDMLAFKAKYRRLTELAGVIEAMDEIDGHL